MRVTWQKDERSKGLCSAISQPLTVLVHLTFLGMASLARCSHTTGICSFSLMSTALCITQSGVSGRISNPITHCLASQAFLWKLSRNLYDPAILAFYMLAKPESCGCQVLLPAGPLESWLWHLQVPGWLKSRKLLSVVLSWLLWKQSVFWSFHIYNL